MLRLQIFQVFFSKKLILFTVLTPYTPQVRKVKSAKNHFLVIFYSGKSISDHFTISELFQVSAKNQFFSLFRTLYCKDEKHEVRKKSFLVLFYSAKSNSDHVTTSNFSSFFFQKIHFVLLFRPPIRHTWEKWREQKIIFQCSSIVQNPFQTILRFQNFFKFFQKINFFYCFKPYIAKVRNMRSEKNHFYCSFKVQNPFQTNLRFKNFFKFFFQNINFFHCIEPYTAKVRSMRSEKNHF